MRQDSGELACDRSVHKFHDIEVRWKQNIEVALVYLLFISPEHLR
jgi:hypothetical protein